MILSFLAAALAVQSAGASDDLPNLFVSACLDGSVRMKPGDATAIQFGELPAALRSRLGKPSGGKVWKLRSPDRSYLYVLDFQGSASTRVCGVAGENLDVASGAAAIGVRLRGSRPATTTMQSTEWLAVNDYKAMATRTGGFTVLQVNWLNEHQAEVPQTQ